MPRIIKAGLPTAPPPFGWWIDRAFTCPTCKAEFTLDSEYPVTRETTLRLGKPERGIRFRCPACGAWQTETPPVIAPAGQEPR